MNSKKNIGILTFHNALNYGANLQAYALQKFINDNIGESEIIDFIPFKKEKRNIIKDILRLLKRFINHKYNENIKRRNAFVSFQKRYYKLSNKRIYIGDEYEKVISKYNVIVSGSDQILNTDLTNGCSFYYLPFSNDFKKISYSSSFGKEILSALDIEYVKRFLSQFKCLSFREESGIKNVEALLPNQKIVLTCDPVFLLPTQYWVNLTFKSNLITGNKDYIFVYAMENSPQIEKCIDYVKRKEQLPIFAIYGDTKMEIKGVDVVIKTAGPIDFIKFINGSKFVITNSFHGASFSFIFGKNAYICSHSTRNTRIETLLKISRCYDKICEDPKKIPKLINGKEAYKHISESLVNQSKEYLYNSLKKLF